MKLLVIIALFLPVICYAEVGNVEVHMYETKISLLNELIERVCSTNVRMKRDTASIALPNVLRVLESHYEELVEYLVTCQCNATTTTTTTPPSSTATTADPIPEECLSATNLTDSWRLDHDGGQIQGGGPSNQNGWACDLRDSLQWFRFTGAAGNRMLNTCPQWYSCGATYPYWTDDDMPHTPGEVATVNVYGAKASECKAYPRQLQVMRCSLSTPHDLIYNYMIAGGWTASDYGCNEAFCGMI